MIPVASPRTGCKSGLVMRLHTVASRASGITIEAPAVEAPYASALVSVEEDAATGGETLIFRKVSRAPCPMFSWGGVCISDGGGGVAVSPAAATAPSGAPRPHISSRMSARKLPGVFYTQPERRGLCVFSGKPPANGKAATGLSA